MNFSNENYKLIALNTSTNDYSHTHTPGEAFFILINSIEQTDLDNLCKYISNYYHEWGAWIVFMAGLTPFPYKVITITSGVLGLDIWVFGVASILARGGRFYLIAFLLKKFGAPMKVFIEKNLGMLSALFVLLLFGGFYLIKYL